MNVITNRNFKEMYPVLEQALTNANFIAIDTELSGITSDNIQLSLFDTVSERYDKYRKIIQPHMIIQFGISTFQRVPNKNEYTAETFNFYLLPRLIPTKDRQYVFTASTLEFLTTYGFDFNKLFCDGITYTNEEDQENLRKLLQKDVSVRNIERLLSLKQSYEIKCYNNQVAEWLNKTDNDKTRTFKIVTSNMNQQYIMHKELRNRFPNIWTLSGQNNLITVMEVPSDVRKVLEQQEGSILENALLDFYVGFSKVFNLLVTLKKPIIAHNAMLDIMFIYQQFYKPLPAKYTHFKSNIHELFPTIYDTKFLSYETRNIVPIKEKWNLNSLGELFDYFRENNIYTAAGSPIVSIVNSSSAPNVYSSNDSYVAVSSATCHTAGWDAYFSGYIFVKIMHIFALEQYEKNLLDKFITHTELMSSVQNFANCINIIRGRTTHLNLEGPEPKSTRPNWFYVKSLKPTTEAQMTKEMSKFAINVKQYTPKRMIIAAPTYRSAQEVLQYLEQNKQLYEVVPYNVLRHSPAVQLVLWGSAIVSSGIFAWMFHQRLRKTSIEHS